MIGMGSFRERASILNDEWIFWLRCLDAGPAVPEQAVHLNVTSTEMNVHDALVLQFIDL